MAWTQKKYARINWKNRPSTATALGATNLNKIDVFLNEVDNALIDFDANKLGISTANGMLKSLTINPNTGIIVATELSGKTYTWDLNLEKIPVSFSLSSDGILTMTTSDGTKFTANIADLIKDYVFDDSETIDFTKTYSSGDGAYHVTAIVKNGSITAEKLNPDYRAQIQSYTNIAQSAAADSMQYSKDSKRWAVGDPDYVGSDTDNSKYYSEQSKLSADAAKDSEIDAKSSADTAVEYLGKVEQAGEDAVDAIHNALDIDAPNFLVDLSTGHLMYSGGRFTFNVNDLGHLMWGLAV